MDPIQLKFITDLTGFETNLQAFEDLEVDRRAAFGRAVAGLEGKKDEIREAMKVRLVDGKGKEGRPALSGKGQEYDIDTFGATRKGQGLTAADMKKVGMALKLIADAAKAILETTTRDGKPLFRKQVDFERALSEELFSPLVRQGVLPENFVIDQYSEVQKLLNAAFASYKEHNAEESDDRETKHAEAKGKYHGSDTGLKKFGAVASRLATAPTRLADKAGFDKNKRRQASIFTAGVQALMSMAEMGTTLKSWQLDGSSGRPKIETNFAKQLNPKLANFNDADPDEARSKILKVKRDEKIADLGLSQADQTKLCEVLDLQDDGDLGSVQEGVGGLGGEVLSVITEIGLPAVKLKALEDAMKSAHHEAGSIVAALKVAHVIDVRLVTMLNKHFRSAGAAIAGMYANAVDVDAVAEAASETKADDQAIIKEFGLAFELVLSQGLDPALKGEGKKLTAAFINAADGIALQKAIADDPATAFASMVTAAEIVLEEALADIDPRLKNVIDCSVMKGLAVTVAKQIDDDMVNVLKAASPSAAEAFAGLYAAEVDVKGLVAAVLATPINGDRVVASLANAFHSSMAQAAPDPSNTAFLSVGKAMAAAFKSMVDTGALTAGLATDPGAAFRPVILAAKTVVNDALTNASDLIAALATPEAQQALAARSAFPDNGEAALADLEASDEEIRDYERQLVLIDQDGIAAAELNTIEGLINKLERDRMIAEMIIATGGILTGMASGMTTIIGQQTVAVTDTLVGEIVGPLKAAKLIVKFAVAMKQANDRRILLQKFKRSLNLAKHAISPMQSTIQGFFNNKVEQVTFRMIEDALTLVQIASAILGSVPEPITLAVGKSLSAIATASEGALKLTEMIYDEAMLSKGWSTMLVALRNPRDRVTGLAALKLNPTLGMHAIAWAGMERLPPDPIARALLADLGLDEQTLMVSGSEAKVRKYLETLLSEDRTLLDPDLISPKWIPKPLKLNSESWTVAVHRAFNSAEPRLKQTVERNVLECFKIIDQQDMSSLADRSRTGAVETTEMERHRADAAALTAALRNYRPVTHDGTEHDEMVSVVANFMKMSADHAAEVTRIAVTNANAQTVDEARVIKRATDKTTELDLAIKDNTVDKLEPAFELACLTMREIQIARMDLNEVVKPKYEALRDKVLLAGAALQTLTEAQDEQEEDAAKTS